MTIEFSWDDGLREDLQIIELLLKYNQKATFYIPSNTDLSPSDIMYMDKVGMEIGGHTVSHFQDLKLLDDDVLKFEIEENKKWLEEVIGKKIIKFCYPRGRHDARVMKAVLDAGFVEARTTVVLNTGYGGFDKHTTVHFYPREEYKVENKTPFEIAKYFILTHKEGEYLRFWGHSREFLSHYKLEQLEDLLKFIKENDKDIYTKLN